MLKPSATDDSGVDDSAEEADDRKGPPKLFTISLVNSYGNMTLKELKNDGEPLQLSSELNLHCFSVLHCLLFCRKYFHIIHRTLRTRRPTCVKNCFFLTVKGLIEFGFAQKKFWINDFTFIRWFLRSQYCFRQTIHLARLAPESERALLQGEEGRGTRCRQVILRDDHDSAQ